MTVKSVKSEELEGQDRDISWQNELLKCKNEQLDSFDYNDTDG